MSRPRHRAAPVCAALAALWPLAALAADAAPPAGDAAYDALAHDIFKQLIEIDTSDSTGNDTTAAEALAQRFRDAGFPAADLALLGPDERKKNLVVRLHGSGAHRPVLLIGHLDVVEARREDWTTDPYKLVEKDGYYYGRGTIDMKDGDAVMATALIRMRKQGFHPSRDIIAAFTADEEGGCCNGVNWLLRNHRALIDAEFVLNQDDWSVVSEHGVPRVARLIAAEKLYSDYQLSVTNRGGHSSEPRQENAIYELARGLIRLARFQFPFELNSVNRGYFEQMVNGVAKGQEAEDMRAILKDPPDALAIARLSRDPQNVWITRTTCVATRLAGGHANNALPQRAEAVVNCRIFPGHSKEEIRQTLIRVLSDPQITVRYVADDGSIFDRGTDERAVAPAPLRPQIVKAMTTLAEAEWPGVKVIPSLDAAASDAKYTMAAGIPTYTFGGVAMDSDDVRAHGRDERLAVAEFYKWNRFFYRYVAELTGQ
ncbi:MAG TPA: M20/M25/M40 family metallo-hydrolase [Candidatus Dormibacteraeota bacterium]|nr:M20/M25/M40 family metallo-hydrolase [Candidatus Dormibacteraeota bacterium]